VANTIDRSAIASSSVAKMRTFSMTWSAREAAATAR
jgi:hypothetical protein